MDIYKLKMLQWLVNDNHQPRLATTLILKPISINIDIIIDCNINISINSKNTDINMNTSQGINIDMKHIKIDINLNIRIQRRSTSIAYQHQHQTPAANTPSIPCVWCGQLPKRRGLTWQCHPRWSRGISEPAVQIAAAVTSLMGAG